MQKIAPLLWFDHQAGEAAKRVVDGLSARFQTCAAVTPQTIESSPEQEKAAYQWLRAAWGDWRMSVDEMITEGDRVMVRWTFSGVQQGEFHGLPPTGRPVSYAGIDIFRIENGKIAKVWDLYDRL